MLDDIDRGVPTHGVVDGDAAVLDRIRSACLSGISKEISMSDAHQALQTYLSAPTLGKLLTSFPFPIPPYLNASQSTSIPRLPFESHREVHRQLSMALTRAAIISSRSPNSLTQTLRILRTYHAYSYSWSSAFRPIQRQRILLLYLRALLAAYPPAGVACVDPYLFFETGSIAQPARMVWRREVSEAMRLGRNLLTGTTSFPRAGAVNAPVADFAKLCVALYDRDQAFAREVISILWWAMTLTFHSQSVLRQLTRLLAAVGDSLDARRTFELYVQLVLKARQTAQPEISLQLKRRPTEDLPAHPAEIALQAEAAKEGEGSLADVRKEQTAEVELDTDEDFVVTLLVGARLLVRELNEAEEAWRYTTLAGDVAENAASRGRSLTKATCAKVETCKGIVRMAMTMLGAHIPNWRKSMLTDRR